MQTAPEVKCFRVCFHAYPYCCDNLASWYGFYPLSAPFYKHWLVVVLKRGTVPVEPVKRGTVPAFHRTVTVTGRILIIYAEKYIITRFFLSLNIFDHSDY